MKRLSMLVLLLCLFSLATVTASAVDYAIDGASSAEFAQSTSVIPVVTADGGEMANIDLSKNNPTVAPAFGSNTSYLPGSGEPLYPFLGVAPSASQPSNSVWGSTPEMAGGSSSSAVTFPDSFSQEAPQESSPSYYGFTEVTSQLYYSGNYLGRIKIPSLGVNVKIYQGTENSQLAKGVGHFEETSIWDGNVALAAHNRGTNAHFGQIHTLQAGDTITLTTKLGTRVYEVTSVSKVSETDRSALAPTARNTITLYTCVRDQRDQRWCVQGVEIV